MRSGIRSRIRSAAICCFAVALSSCVREVDYSVKNIGNDPALNNAGVDLTVLKSEGSPYTQAKWRVHSDQVRVSLPHFSGANMFLSVLSGGEVDPGWLVMRLQYERYRAIDSGGLTPVFDPRVTITCDGWYLERKSERYPIDASDCGNPMTLGATDSEWRTLKFPVPDSFDEFVVHSPAWQINWTLRPGDGTSHQEESSLQLPPVVFHRTGERRSLDLAIR